ncbi:hypothetical protein B0H11DRAFT_187049 [Mycena galericulata]|nr:hypothetical protein B0H11DRAFT_187049 [Mycena galericulata]
MATAVESSREGPNVSTSDEGCFHDLQVKSGWSEALKEPRPLLDPLPPGPALSDQAWYVHLMLTRRRGFPLAEPLLSLTLPEEHLRKGICIGDIGSIFEDVGIFDFLFNIFLPADDPINGGENNVPRNFTPLNCLAHEEIIQQNYPPNSHVTTGFAKMRSSLPIFSNALSFRSTSSRGAICALPHGSMVEEWRDLRALRRYAISQAEDWYHCAITKRGRLLLNGSLYFITATEKTDAWGTATFRQLEYGNTCMHLVPRDDPNQSYPFYWCHSPASVSTPTSQQLGENSHCLFLRGFKISLGHRAWSTATERRRRIFKHHDPRTSWIARLFAWLPKTIVSLLWTRPSWFANAYFATFPKKFFHPSTVISEYLLGRVPNAEVVIVHDDDWTAVISDDEQDLPDAAEMIRRIQNKYKIVNDHGGVYLALRTSR